MAKPKKSVLVEQLSNHLRVWCDNPKRWISELRMIDGIVFVDEFSTDMGCLMLQCDPRYDISELIQEIENLLTAEIPDVFRE